MDETSVNRYSSTRVVGIRRVAKAAREVVWREDKPGEDVSDVVRACKALATHLSSTLASAAAVDAEMIRGERDRWERSAAEKVRGCEIRLGVANCMLRPDTA